MLKINSILGLGLCALAVGGCKSEEEEPVEEGTTYGVPEVDVPAAVPPEDVHSMLVDVECAKRARCSIHRNSTFESCTASGARRIDTSGALFEARESAALIAFDAELASSCLRAYLKSDCDDSAGPLDCAGVWAGSVEEGEPCAADEECGPSRFCDESNVALSCGGTCQPFGEENAECGVDGDCDSDLYCDDIEKKCLPQASAGEECQIGHNSCSGTASCFSDDGTNPGLCYTVENFPWPGEGELCDPDRSKYCEPGLVCHVASGFGKCIPPYESGEECFETSPSGCPENEYCEGAAGAEAGACAPRISEGEECTYDAQCVVGATCDDGECGMLARLGEECSVSSECASGECDEIVCIPPEVPSCDTEDTSDEPETSQPGDAAGLPVPV